MKPTRADQIVSTRPGKAPAGYAALLDQIKQRIRQAQTRAILSANAEMVRLYWEIGGILVGQQKLAGWGAGVLRRLATDLHNELPEVKGFSHRNLKLMAQFHREYPHLSAVGCRHADPLEASKDATPIGQPPVAQLSSGVPRIASPRPVSNDTSIGQPLVAQLPWAHNVLLMQKVKDLSTRLWYMQRTIQHGWSRNMLALQIGARAHERHGKAITNFHRQLPPEQSDLALQALKDPYIFDFLTLEEPFHERELETQLLLQLEKFLLELGQGFAFVGRQYRVQVGQEDFYIDLLFYHLFLRCFVVIDLKKGAFKAEYAGKMHFYLNVLDDRLRHPADAPSIGLILCQDRNRVVAEYALRGLPKPIGISEYELTRALPRELQSSLPSIEDIEAELRSQPRAPRAAPGKRRAIARAVSRRKGKRR